MTWITPLLEALPSVLAVLTVVLGLSWLLGRGTRSAPKQAGRFPNLDGLRAYLALGVVCCHLATLKIDLLDEKLWSWPQNYFLTLAGQGSVAMFFMITGFLFWSKILAAGGKIDALALYKNRFLRIMPLYALFYAVVVTIVAIRSDFTLRVPIGQLIHQLATFAVPGLNVTGSLNRIEKYRLAVQSWSLWPELIFYFLLPFLSFFSTRRLIFAVLSVGLWIYVVYSHNYIRLQMAEFWVGIVAAYLQIGVKPRPWMIGWPISLVLTLAIIAPSCQGATSAGVFGFCVVSCSFFSVVLGNTFFGLLTLSGARRLGDMSYSIYLLHLPLLFLYLPLVNQLNPVAALSNIGYSAECIPLIALIAGISWYTFRFIEKPFMTLKKKVVPTGPSVATG